MTSYKIQRARVVYEVLNTEVILIDFHSGNYYALIHVAKLVWQLIEQQVSFPEISQIISNHFQREIESVSRDIQFFIQRLLEEGLIEPAAEEVRGSGALQTEAHRFPYEAPQLQKYTDVQNLLLLDPIHEVAEAGWPAASQESETANIGV